MTKPWSTEPTPRTDAARVVYGGEAIEALSDSVSVAFARSLERQLRAAECHLAISCDYAEEKAEDAAMAAGLGIGEWESFVPKWWHKAKAHLAAAREEDGE